MEIKVNRLLQPTGFAKDHNPTDLAAFERGIYTFLPSNACLLRDYVYPLVRREPNLFPHPFVHLLHDRSELPLDINEIRSRFPRLDKQYYFVMLEGPTVGRENAIEIRGSKTFWSQVGDEVHVDEWGYSYGDATLYDYIHGESAISWNMAVYQVDPQGVLKCGPVELGLHQVELRWKAIKIFPKYSNIDFRPDALPTPVPRLVMSGPPTGEENAIEIGGTKVFWKKIGEKRTIYEGGFAYGDATKYTYIRGERDIGWYMIIYHVNLLQVRVCGPVLLGLNQIESRWTAIKIYPKCGSMLVYDPIPGPLPVLVPPAPLSDESPPPPPLSPPASIGSKLNCRHPLALSGNKRNRFRQPA
ncbi:uncharacterized protein LOC132161683 isoform X3 [Corylus avellana]|uniref:uncharacterized protein LOC132161683 isoform X3 n=1 Tax=Corylus avellana TaxID=13451 RepID=UPI00286BF9C2|nr:uncharacterized protein LOC132161683 isoform X3 [Corylus avellana]